MGKMSNEEIIMFARDFAVKIFNIDSELVEDVTVRRPNLIIWLENMVGLDYDYHREKKKNENLPDFIEYCRSCEGCWREGKEDDLAEIVPRILEDDTIEAIIFCEGSLWEKLYYCEAYGSRNEDTLALYNAFLKTTNDHNMWYEWGSGNIFLYKYSE